MKSNIFHKIFSVTLAFLVSFSTVSFTVEKHYCGDSLVDTAVFSELKTCITDSENGFYTKKSCCKDTVEVFEGQNELTTNADFEDLEYSQQLILSAHFYSYPLLFESLPKLIIPNKEYSPPNLIRDIQLLDDKFLI